MIKDIFKFVQINMKHILYKTVTRPLSSIGQVVSEETMF